MSAASPSIDHDEPETPSWFTLLGVAIFLLGGIFALVAAETSEDELVEGAQADAAAEQAAGDEAPEPQAAPAAEPAAAVDPHAGHGH